LNEKQGNDAQVNPYCATMEELLLFDLDGAVWSPDQERWPTFADLSDQM